MAGTTAADEAARLVDRRATLLGCADLSEKMSPLGRTLLQAEIELAGPPFSLADRPNEPIANEAIVICGPPRSGTTLFHWLLSLHPACQWIAAEDAACPNGGPGDLENTRKLISRRVYIAERLSPSLLAAHDIFDHGPEECNVALLRRLRSFQYAVQFDLPGYLDWMMSDDSGQDVSWLVDLLGSSCGAVGSPLHSRLQRSFEGSSDDSGRRVALFKSPAHGFDLHHFSRHFGRVLAVSICRDGDSWMTSWLELVAAARSVTTARAELDVLTERSQWGAFFGEASDRQMDAASLESVSTLEIPYASVENPVDACTRILSMLDLDVPKYVSTEMSQFARSDYLRRRRRPAGRKRSPHDGDS